MNRTFPLGNTAVPARTTRRLWVALTLLLAGLPLLGQAQTTVVTWPLDAANTGNPTGAATGLTGAAVTLSDLNTLTTSPYTDLNGQSFAALSDGNWDSRPAGNNRANTLFRNRYEQFAVAVDNTHTLTANSISFNTAVIGSTSGRLVVTYSTDGFMTSQDITAVTRPTGASATGTGIFGTGTTSSNGIQLPSTNATNGTGGCATATCLTTAGSGTGGTRYTFTLNSTSGVPVAAGATLSIRLHYNVNTTSLTAPALLRNVAIDGAVTTLAPLCNATTGLSATPGSNGTTASIAFTAGSGNTTNISVARTTGGAVDFSTTGGTTSPVSATGLQPNTAYTVTATATCTGGTASTATTTFTTPAAPVCADPTGVTANALSSTSGRLSFTAGSGNTSYVLTITPQGGSATTITPAPTASPVNFTSLTSGTSYTVTLQSNCSGNGGIGSLITRTFMTPVANSTVLQEWSMRVSNADSAAIRSAGVTASTPTLHKLTLSNGTTTPGTTPVDSPPVPAYSAKLGQGFAVTSNGFWNSANGGPGGTLTGAFYEQFTITASATQTVRIDSITFNSWFYGSNSNTKIALLYSKNGFTAPSDSTNVVAGMGYTLDAATQSVISYGAVTASIANPIALVPNYLATTPYVAPNPNIYRLALNGNTGVTIAPGQVLTFRMYFSCGSGSAGRYALLRDVIAKGQATFTAPTCGTPTGLSVGNITSNSASLTFTPGSGGNVTYTVQVTPAAGAPTTVTPTPSSSPVTLTGLQPSTNYTVTVQANCGVGNLNSGTASTTFTTTAQVLQRWSLRLIDGDSAAVRNAAVTASSRTAKRLVLADGTTVAAVQPRSAKFGTAVAPLATGLGWSSGAGGPGATPNVRFYEQFTVTAAASNNVRVDAVNFNAEFYGGAASLAVAYSLNGFQAGTDSTQVTGATISSPIALAGTTTLNGTPRRLVLNGATGLTLTPGQTLTLRFYFAAGTTSNRYAFLRDMNVEGAALPATVGNLTVSSTQGISGTYNNVTITSTGVATLGSNLVVNGTLTVQSGGMLNTNCQTVTGAGSFTLAAGGSLGICDAAGLPASGASGAIQVTGARSFSNDATYIYNGPTAQNTGTGLPATVRGLSVAYAPGTTTAHNVTLSQPVSVRQVASLTGGNLITGGNGFTLQSVSGQGTALLVNGVTTTAGTYYAVVGTATMQRAIDVLTDTNDGYRHFTTPMSNSVLNDLTTANFTPTFNTAYNTAAQAGMTRTFPTVFGYDETRVGSTTVATDQSPINQGYFSPSGTDAWPVMRGYSAVIPNAARVNFTGTFNNGNVGITGLTRGTDGQAGYHLLGNPYPSPVDASTIVTAQRPGVGSAIYVYHATSTYTGTYSSIANGVGSTADASSPASSLIDAGTAFFMRVSTAGTPGSLNLTSTNRVTTFGAQPAFGRQTSSRPQLEMRVRGANLSDILYVYSDAAATTGFDAEYDAAKMHNTNGLNLAAVAGTDIMAINALPMLTATTVVPLSLGAPAPGTYTLELTQLANFNGMQVYLRDAVAGTEQLFTAAAPVSVTLSNVATATTRFSLVFRPSGVTATTNNVLAAQASVYPNPAHDSFSLLLPPVAGAAKATATLVNGLGQMVSTRAIALTAGGATADYSTSGLAAGVYALRLQAGGLTSTLRVVVQ